MNIKLTATDNLTEWIEKNSTSINLPINEIKVNNYGEYINLKLQDANQFVELISRISEIDPVIVIKANPKNIEIEVYNDCRE